MLKKKYFIKTLPDSLTKGLPTIHPAWSEVPLIKVPYTDKYEVNPTDAACMALMGDEKALDWLLDNQDRETGVYWHWYNDVYYGIAKPWCSGLTQALAASALIRHGYKKEANMAMWGLYDNSYFDGYVTEKPGVIVINAWIFALFAMQDMCDAGEFYQWMLEPTLAPDLPVPYQLPRTIFQDPIKPEKPPKPIKGVGGASTATNLLSAGAGLASTLGKINWGG